MQILRVDGTRPLEAIYGTTSLFHCFYAVFENLKLSIFTQNIREAEIEV